MVSVRIAGIFGAGLLAMTGVVQASSIVALGIATSTPSIIRLQAIEPVGLSAASTPSFVALGDPVSDETVAAIPEDSEYARARMPTIIRGGVVGGAFATPATKATTPAASAPANGKTSATATPPNGTASTLPNSTASTPPNGNADASGNKTASASGGAQQSASQKPTKLPPVSKPM